MTDVGDQALALWRRWFDKFGDPWIPTGRQLYCCFCDGYDGVHETDCVWVLAKALIKGGQNDTENRISEN